MTQAQTRNEVIRTVAELVAALAVPVSLGMPLGDPVKITWGKLYRLGGSFGWVDADAIDAALQEALREVRCSHGSVEPHILPALGTGQANDLPFGCPEWESKRGVFTGRLLEKEVT